MSAPLVSVIVPCYNQAHFLGAAIDSVRMQDPYAEIVVVDDGSTDNTRQLAASRAGVRCVRQENRGLAGARNRGLEESNGAMVIFLDADDCLLPGGIGAGVTALAARPDCAMAYGRCLMMGPDGSHWPTSQPPPTRADHHVAFLRSNMIWMPAAAIFRREALERPAASPPDSMPRPTTTSTCGSRARAAFMIMARSSRPIDSMGRR
jgi:glycosyltransferase involved in cell wall biosynthesis